MVASSPVMWLVSYADDDDRELTTEQVLGALTRGELTADTIAWREGLSDWQPLVKLPEFERHCQALALGGGAPTPPPKPAAEPTAPGGAPRPSPFRAAAAAMPSGPPPPSPPSPRATPGKQPEIKTSLEIPSRRPPAPAPLRGSTKLGMPSPGTSAARSAAAPPVAARPRPPAPRAAQASAPELPKPAHAPKPPLPQPRAGTTKLGIPQAPRPPAPKRASVPDPEPAAPPPSPTPAELRRAPTPPLPKRASVPDPEPTAPPPSPAPAAAALDDAEPISVIPKSLPSNLLELDPSDLPPSAAEPQLVRSAAAERSAHPQPAAAERHQTTLVLGSLTEPASEATPREDAFDVPLTFDAGLDEHPLGLRVTPSPSPTNLEHLLGASVGPQLSAPVLPTLDQPRARKAAIAPEAETVTGSSAPRAAREGAERKLPWGLIGVGLLAAGAALWFGLGRSERPLQPAAERALTPPAPESPPAAVTTEGAPAPAPAPEPEAASPPTVAADSPRAPTATHAAEPAPRGAIAAVEPRPEPRSAPEPATPPEPSKATSTPAAEAPPSPPPAEPPPARPATPSAAEGAEFDRGAASAALSAAASEASGCRKEGDPSGTATVTVTFAPSGRVTSATLSGPPFAGTSTGGCIAATLRRARVPAFSGSNVTVSKRVVIQ